MRRCLELAVLFLLALGGFGAASPRADEGPVVTISEADCRRLAIHRPAPDVAYQPGVDVYGRPVVPADMNGGLQIVVPETIYIPITVDLFDRFGIPVDPTSFEAEAVIGEVVYQDGRAYFNGQPLQDEAAAELSDLCQAAMRQAP